jgi:hypothetical protein
MAYDVDRQAGAWVSEQAVRRVRSFVLFYGGLLAAFSVFVIETKFKRYEDAQLAKVKRQALRLHDDLGCWVTPVICAGVRKKSFVHKRVLITGRGLLAETILAQTGHGPVDPERLARFADRLD